MARPERKNVDYFPHYISHGSKMQYLHNKFGNDGYAVWYKMMEKLAKADNHFIDLSDEINLELFADYCLVDIDALNSIINFLCRCNWMHKKLWNDHKVVYSPEFLESVKDAYKRRSNVCINTQGIELMYYNNPQGTELMGDINTQSKVEYSKEEKTKEETLKPAVFDKHQNEKNFLKDWNELRFKHLKKKTDLRMLSTDERDNFNELFKNYSREEMQEAVVGLFKQKKFPRDSTSMTSNPKHFLKFFNTYFQAYNDKNMELYGKKESV